MNGNAEVFVPAEYHGREQAYVKHTILRTYIERLFLIIGRHELVINYVDCFAGPWEDESDDLHATSIGISILHIKRCQAFLQNQFKKTVKFRALYIEKNKHAYARLRSFIESQRTSDVELESLHGDYVDRISDILQWCGAGFTFFFIDPKGWKQIGASTLQPLLSHPRSEFLINVMYEFANRAATMSQLGDTFTHVFGSIPWLEDAEPEEREMLISNSYRQRVNAIYGGRHSMVRVERPGRDRALYFLVYLTRHPYGISVFKDAAETMAMVQRRAHLDTKLRKQLAESSHIGDLFGVLSIASRNTDEENNKAIAKEYLLKRLESGVLLIDHDCWADFFEHTECYPSDFQKAMKELVSEKRVSNLDTDVSRRRTKIIKPDWPNCSERWALTSTDLKVD